MPRLTLVLASLLLGASLVSTAADAQLATRKSSDRGVTVAVTPANLAADAKTWDFSLVLDTHSQELSDDLPASALLVDSEGREFKALAWEGAAPGGHHRSGVLKFKPIAPQPRVVELRMKRPGEAKARVFRWELK